MRRRYRDEDRDVRFEVVDGRLVRTVFLPDGRSYMHRCTLDVFEAVAYGIEQQGDAGVTLEPLAAAVDAPSTQVNVALEFLKERGCVATRGRRNYPASDFLLEDAMVELCYLAHGCPPEVVTDDETAEPVASPVPVGTAVEINIAQGLAMARGIVQESDHDDGWMYRINVTGGDRCDDHRRADGELWVCDFEVTPLSA